MALSGMLCITVGALRGTTASGREYFGVSSILLESKFLAGDHLAEYPVNGPTHVAKLMERFDVAEGVELRWDQSAICETGGA